MSQLPSDVCLRKRVDIAPFRGHPRNGLMVADLEIMVDTACRCPKKRWIQLLKWSNSTTLDVCTLINKDSTA